MIIGISTDPLQLQQKFTDKNNLNFPLLADPGLEISKAFGVLPPGKKNAKRATFIIGKDGNVAKIFATVGNAKGHPQEILEFVEKKLSGKN